MTPIRLAIWTAVSSKAQSHATSLDDQATLAQTYATSINATITRTYRTAHTRNIIRLTHAEQTIPAYHQLTTDITNHHFDQLWTLDIDRLGRDPALSQAIISLLLNNNLTCYIHLSRQHIRTTPDRYIPSIQSIRAKEDSELRTHRSAEGMAARTNTRGLIASLPPFGYTPIRNPRTGKTQTYALDHNRPALHLITTLILAGHSYTEIARRLNQTPHRPARAGTWRPSTIRAIAHNDTYAGIPRWHPSQPTHPSPNIEPLWDPHIHTAIITERTRRSTSYTRKNAGPLAGVIYCNQCQARLTRLSHKGHHYLRCSTHARKAITGIPCHPNHMPEHRPLTALTHHLAQLATPAALDHALTHLTQTHQHTTLQDQLTAAQRTITNLQNQRQNIAADRAKRIMAPDIYTTTDRTLLTQLHTAQQQIPQLTHALNTLPDPHQQHQALTHLAHTFPQLLAHAHPTEIATLLHTAGIRIYTHTGQIHHIHPPTHTT